MKIAGMNPYETVARRRISPRAYASKPIWQRALAILAGPFSHFLMGGLLFFARGVRRSGTDRAIVDELAPRLGDGPRRPSRRGSARGTWSSASATSRT